MNLAVFRGRRFVRYEVRPGPLADGHIRVPVKVPAQPPHVPSMHYLWSTCRLDDDEKGATVHYSVHDREQSDIGSEAPTPRPVIVESPPAHVPPPVDDMSQRLDDLATATADLGESTLRMQQEIAELRSALAVTIRALDAIKIQDDKARLRLDSGAELEVVKSITVHKAVLSKDDQEAIRKVS